VQPLLQQRQPLLGLHWGFLWLGNEEMEVLQQVLLQLGEEVRNLLIREALAQLVEQAPQEDHNR
jgi:hypothetical protein